MSITLIVDIISDQHVLFDFVNACELHTIYADCNKIGWA